MKKEGIMDKGKKRVAIDQDGRSVEGFIASEKLSMVGLLKIKLDDGPTVVRSKDRVTALDEEARAFLKGE